jgi:hypothetical protein
MLKASCGVSCLPSKPYVRCSFEFTVQAIPDNDMRQNSSCKKGWWPGVVAHTCNLSYTEDIGRTIAVWDQPVQKCKTLPEKQLKQERAAGMTQVVEHLISEHKPPYCQNTTTKPLSTRRWFFKVPWERTVF